MKIKTSKRKGISSIISTALLLIVVVVSVVSFENFMGNYQSIIFSDVEQKSIIEKNTQIESFIGNSIYLKNFDDNLNILEIKIDNNICNFSNLSLKLGLNKIKLKKCVKKSGVSDVMILTNKGLIEKKLFLKKVEGCDFGSKFLETGEKILSFKENKISFPNTCESEQRTCLKSGKLSGSFEFESCEVEPLDYFMSLKDFDPNQKYDRLHSLVDTDDDNFFLLGRTRGHGSNVEDIFLQKVNKNGQEIWAKLYGFEKKDRGQDILRLDNGDFILSSWTDSFYNDNSLLISRIDGNGEEVWSKVLHNKSESNFKVVQVGSDEFVAVGSSQGLLCSQGYLSHSNIAMLKFDLDGNKIWSRCFGGDKGNNYHNTAYGVLELEDGNFIVTGQIRRLNAYGLYVAKFNSDGNKVWAKVFQGDKSEFGWKIVKDKENNFFVVGRSISFSSKYNVLVLKLDKNGNKIWAKSVGGSENDLGKEVVPLEDGGVVVLGETRNYEGGVNKGLFLKFDKVGSLVLSKVLDYGNTFYIQDSLALEDNSFFTAGFLIDSQTYFSQNVLLKLNNGFDCEGCLEFKDISLSVYDLSLDLVDLNFQIREAQFSEMNVDLDEKEIKTNSSYVFYG